MNFEGILKQAETSKFGLWKLNFLLHRFIPFNKPHNLKIRAISKQQVKVEIPYQTSNLNHIKGLHACGLATVAEYASGLLLLYKLGMKKYRLIMEKIEVEYHYQGKMNAFAQFELNEEAFQKTILELESKGQFSQVCEIPVIDLAGNQLCTVRTHWQIKSWEKVKTKL
tara:strand:- start:5244 stop:5747 length:504 start_codon:yes stop_codon:yes gene_type:complete